MKKLLSLFVLVFPVMLQVQAQPFVATPDPGTMPIHWYNLNLGDWNIYATPDPSGQLVQEVWMSMGGDDHYSHPGYIWCFVGDPESGYRLYNKQTKSYLSNGAHWSDTGPFDYCETDNGEEFYIYCNIPDPETSVVTKQYLTYKNNEGFSFTTDKQTTFRAIEVNVEEDPNVTPQASISFDTYESYCEVKATGVGTIQLYVNSSSVDNPYRIQRTNKDMSITVTATAQEQGKEMSTITKRFTVPKLEGSDPDHVVLTFTPYDVHTPNNVNGNQNEDYHKLFDKIKATKWCVDNGTDEWETIWVDFKSNVAFIPTGYTMTTGNDTQRFTGRNPKKWKIYAKANENDSWTTIVNVTDGDAAGLGTNNTTDYSFTINGINTEYQYFRFEVSEVRGKGGWQNNHYVFQLGELALDGVTPSIVVGDVNGDGRVNVSDVSTLINMILGITDKDEETADVNGDGRVNVSDVTALINIILGIN